MSDDPHKAKTLDGDQEKCPHHRETDDKQGPRQSYRFPPMSPERRAEGRRIAAEKIAAGEWGLFPCGEDEREEAEYSCGAGHGSLEGHTGWCDFVSLPEPDKELKNGD